MPLTRVIHFMKRLTLRSMVGVLSTLAGLALVVPALLALAVWAFWPRPVNWEPVFDVAVAAGDCEKANAILAAAREASYRRAIEIHLEGPPETCAHALSWPERYAEPARVLLAYERGRQRHAEDDAQRRIWARENRAMRRALYSWPERLMDLSVDDVLEPICERPFRATSYAQHAEMKRRLAEIEGGPLWFDANAFAHGACGRAMWAYARSVCGTMSTDFTQDCRYAVSAAARFDVRDAVIQDAIHALVRASREPEGPISAILLVSLEKNHELSAKGDPDARYVERAFFCTDPRPPLCAQMVSQTNKPPYLSKGEDIQQAPSIFIRNQVDPISKALCADNEN